MKKIFLLLMFALPLAHAEEPSLTVEQKQQFCSSSARMVEVIAQNRMTGMPEAFLIKQIVEATNPDDPTEVELRDWHIRLIRAVYQQHPDTLDLLTYDEILAQCMAQEGVI